MGSKSSLVLLIFLQRFFFFFSFKRQHEHIKTAQHTDDNIQKTNDTSTQNRKSINLGFLLILSQPRRNQPNNHFLFWFSLLHLHTWFRSRVDRVDSPHKTELSYCWHYKSSLFVARKMKPRCLEAEEHLEQRSREATATNSKPLLSFDFPPVTSISRSISTLILAEHDGGTIKSQSISAVEAAKSVDKQTSISLLLWVVLIDRTLWWSCKYLTEACFATSQWISLCYCSGSASSSSSSSFFVTYQNDVVLDRTGTERPVRNRGVPAGIRPDFPGQAGILAGTKTSPFCPGFCNGNGAFRPERDGINNFANESFLGLKFAENHIILCLIFIK